MARFRSNYSTCMSVRFARLGWDYCHEIRAVGPKRDETIERVRVCQKERQEESQSCFDRPASEIRLHASILYRMRLGKGVETWFHFGDEAGGGTPPSGTSRIERDYLLSVREDSNEKESLRRGVLRTLHSNLDRRVSSRPARQSGGDILGERGEKNARESLLVDADILRICEK